MQIKKCEFEVWVETSDLERIRDALRRWGKPCDVIENYCGSLLHQHLIAWQEFAETDWSKWDISEYHHDIGCRFWIQLAIENSEPNTADQIHQAAKVSDELFRAKMSPAVESCRSSTTVLRSHPYFWETHTIHPELEASGDA